MRKITIKEIAEMAGISRSAVSLVLNDRPGVSDETRSAVKRLIKQYDYIPNMNSRRLKLQRNSVLALLSSRRSPQISEDFYIDLTNSIARECDEREYSLVITSYFFGDDGQVVLPNVIKSKGVDGVVMYSEAPAEVIAALHKLSLPIVVVDSHYVSKDFVSVYANYEQAAYTAASYLVQLGHSVIGFMGGALTPFYGQQVTQGYLRALGEAKLNVVPALFQQNVTSEETAYSAMERILQSETRATAVFCCADIYAIKAIHCAKDYGFSVPGDISIASVDDIMLARYFDPPLTTIRLDRNLMGSNAVEMLIRKIDGEKVEDAMIPSFTLITRSTTRPI